MNLQEDILSQVIDARPIRHHPVYQSVHEVLVEIHQLAKRRVVAGSAAVDERAFVVFVVFRRHSPRTFPLHEHLR